MQPANSTRHRATAAQKHMVHKLLDQVCTTFKAWNGQDYAMYETGWSDQRVASQLNIPLRTVEHIRHCVFGNVNVPPVPRPVVRPQPAAPAPTSRPTPEVGSASGLAQKILQRLTRAEEIIDEQGKRITALEEYITRQGANGGGLGSAN